MPWLSPAATTSLGPGWTARENTRPGTTFATRSSVMVSAPRLPEEVEEEVGEEEVGEEDVGEEEVGEGASREERRGETVAGEEESSSRERVLGGTEGAGGAASASGTYLR